MLNFENKLAGLEDRPDYPKEKPWYFRPERDSLVDYNIVSNYSVKDHHFDAPEKRPPAEEYKVSWPFDRSRFHWIELLIHEIIHFSSSQFQNVKLFLPFTYHLI